MSTILFHSSALVSELHLHNDDTREQAHQLDDQRLADLDAALLAQYRGGPVLAKHGVRRFLTAAVRRISRRETR